MCDLRPVLHRAAARAEENLAALHASGRYILGEQCRCFEREFASALGSPCAVGTGSGTAALELCLRHAGVVSPHQEVIVPANTSLFAAQAILAAGATPRFADVDSTTLLLTAETAEIAWSPRTAAVIAVHQFGHPCGIEDLARFCRDRNTVLIQDACQAHGLRIQGRALTDFSPYVAYSFYPTKNLGCLGDGGAVLTSSDKIATRLRLLLDGGRDGDQLARCPAINSRLDEMQACYLRAFLPHLDYWNSHRRRIAAIYNSLLEGCHSVRILPGSNESVHHLHVIRVPDREGLRTYLAAEGIQTAVHYPLPLHLHPAFQVPDRAPGVLENAEKACREIVSLPIGPHIDEPLAEYVASCVGRYCQS